MDAHRFDVITARFALMNRRFTRRKALEFGAGAGTAIALGAASAVAKKKGKGKKGRKAHADGICAENKVQCNFDGVDNHDMCCSGRCGDSGCCECREDGGQTPGPQYCCSGKWANGVCGGGGTPPSTQNFCDTPQGQACKCGCNCVSGACIACPPEGNTCRIGYKYVAKKGRCVKGRHCDCPKGVKSCISPVCPNGPAGRACSWYPYDNHAGHDNLLCVDNVKKGKGRRRGNKRH